MWAAEQILTVLDDCCNAYTFPMLDNGYVYLAATRLSLYRSTDDWAIVIEVFGFSPRAGRPDVGVYTFGSRLRGRTPADEFNTPQAYERYLDSNPFNEMRTFEPIAEGSWQNDDDRELVATDAAQLILRGRPVAIPDPEAFAGYGIELENPEQIRTFELCRFLAEIYRDDVLATPEERRVSVPPELTELFVLEAWNHPDVKDEAERPSRSETFRQLADVLASGDVRAYEPSEPPNTDWTNWLESGTL